MIGAGVQPEWWRGGTARFGPTPTPWGAVTVGVAAEDDGVRVTCGGAWRVAPPALVIALPGWGAVPCQGGSVLLQRREVACAS